MTGKQLKNSILQLAIQGKLVPQDPADEPASELLKRIRKEKEQLVKDGKLKKKDLVTTPISDEEKPFEIPESWVWCRLKDIVYNNGQKTPDKVFSYIDIGSIDNKNQKLNDQENLIEAKNAPSRARKIVKYGDIVYSTVRPYLHNVAIIDRQFSAEPIASTGFAVLSTILIYNKYLFYFLLSPQFDEYANDGDNAKGIAYPAINDDKLFKACIPLPPLSEQHRIVAKIEELMPLVEEYDKAQTKLDDLNAKLPEALKKSILQEAIQGKLVPQDPTDEPASILLQRIRKEKEQLVKDGKLKKKDLVTTPITDEEKPFEIPESWEWCRLKDICSKIVDGDHNPPAGLPSKTDYLMLSSQNINYDSLVNLENVRYISKEVFIREDLRTEARIGDVLFTSVGTLGRSCVLKDSLNICFQRSVTVLRTFIYNEYLKRVLDSPVIQDYVRDKATGTAQKGFYINQMEKLLIPLPPLSEQHRIVAKIEELFAILK